MLIVVTLDMAIRGKLLLGGGGQIVAVFVILFHRVCGFVVTFAAIVCLGLFTLFSQTFSPI